MIRHHILPVSVLLAAAFLLGFAAHNSGHATPQPAYFNCGETGVSATPAADGNAMTIDFEGDTYQLSAVQAASGAKYQTVGDVKPQVIFWGKGRQAILTVDGNDFPLCVQVQLNADPAAGKIVAQGQEPFWSLTIDAGKATLGGVGQQSKPFALPKPEVIDNVATYYFPTVEGKGKPVIMNSKQVTGDTIKVASGLCRDTMSGQYFPLTIELTTQAKTLKGCGKPIEMPEPAAGSVAVAEKSLTTKPAAEEMTAAVAKGIDRLTGRVWRAETIADGIIDGSYVTMEIRADGSAAGKASCNRYRTGFTIGSDGSFKQARPMISTMMACAPALMQQEQTFSRLLTTATRYELTADDAFVIYVEGDKKIIFRQDENPPK